MMSPNMTVPPPSEEKQLPSISDAIGGPLGMFETALPTIVFIVMITIDRQEIGRASLVAVIVAAILAAVRLARGQTIRFVAGGLFGVAFSAFVAAKSGKAENFFLPGLLINAAYAAALLISLAFRRPLIGYFVTAFHGVDPTSPWHADRPFARAATRATWIFGAIFLLKLLVQLPMYLTDSLVALGVAKIAMGYPLYALGIWLTWLMMRSVAVPHPEAVADVK